MRARLTSAAEAELTDALEWYEANATKAAPKFLDEFEALSRRLAENPRRFPVLEGEVRRAGFRRYPYGLLFVVGLDGVKVFACFHASRDPRRWRDRI